MRSLSRLGLLVGMLVLIGWTPGIAQAGPVVDQSQEDRSGHAYLAGVENGTEITLAQAFTAGQTGTLDKVDVWLERRSGADTTHSVVVQIRTVDAEGAPASVVAETINPGTDVRVGGAWLTAWFFNDPADVVAGNRYVIVVYSGGTYFWDGGTDRAHGGVFVSRSVPPDSWESSVIPDRAFRTLVTPAPDDDSDGVPNPVDDCPDTLGFVVASDGCPDPDNDNVSNFAGDNCPIDPNPQQENTDGDAHGDACDIDDDGDWVLDEDDDCAGTPSGTPVAADGCPDPDRDNVSTHAGDNCPNDANPDQADTDRDGQGDACDADDDNDGVADGADACAETPSGTTVRPNGCVNTPPVARADAYDTVGGATLSVPALTGVLANDTDAEGDALTAQMVSAPSQGTVVLNANGSFTYTPNEDAFGTDTFTYRAHDGMDPSNTVTVTIRVQAGCEGRPATIIGTSGADNLSGTSGDDVILALGGDDVIDSGSSDDIVCAGSGNDRLQGGSGNDVLRGGSGDDVLDGGSGDDRLSGEAGTDRLRGGGDNDTLDGGTGTPDRCDGEGGTDTATASCETILGVP